MSHFACWFLCRFAAALINRKLDCWVMNVIPVSEPNTLPVIYDRGLLGVAHDWYVSVYSVAGEILLGFLFYLKMFHVKYTVLQHLILLIEYSDHLYLFSLHHLPIKSS